MSAVDILNDMLKTFPKRAQPKFGMITSNEPNKEKEFYNFAKKASPTYAAILRQETRRENRLTRQRTGALSSQTTGVLS
jgi:hypothetical protein